MIAAAAKRGKRNEEEFRVEVEEVLKTRFFGVDRELPAQMVSAVFESGNVRKVNLLMVCRPEDGLGLVSCCLPKLSFRRVSPSSALHSRLSILAECCQHSLLSIATIIPNAVCISTSVCRSVCFISSFVSYVV